jgi:diacylglycerol kinase (ATP)
MSENNKVFFIINKYSGAGFRESLEGRIIDYCSRQNWECTLEFTRQRGHATELAKQAVMQGYNLVVAVGGDGTVNETTQGLIGSEVPLAIIPKGSGNGLARHLGIPLSFTKSLELLGNMKTIQMDTVWINNHLSVNVSGIGFDGHVASLFGKNGKRGLAGYTRLTLREFIKFKEFEGQSVIDGKAFNSRTFLIAIANSSQFGNNARIAPHASVCDGWIDVCFVKKVPLSHALGFARKMFTGEMDRSRFVTIRKAKEIQIHFEKAVPYHVDGEPQEPKQDFTIVIKPGSLSVVVALETETP